MSLKELEDMRYIMVLFAFCLLIKMPEFDIKFIILSTVKNSSSKHANNKLSEVSFILLSLKL